MWKAWARAEPSPFAEQPVMRTVFSGGDIGFEGWEMALPVMDRCGSDFAESMNGGDNKQRSGVAGVRHKETLK